MRPVIGNSTAVPHIIKGVCIIGEVGAITSRRLRHLRIFGGRTVVEEELLSLAVDDIPRN